MAVVEPMQPARQEPATAAARLVLRVVPQTATEMAAVARFNERMRSGGAPTDFLLPDQPNPQTDRGDSSVPITWTKYVVLDQDDEARGGFLLMTQPGWLDGRELPIANYQAPLSEGIIDPRFATVGLHMLRFMQRKWPLTFVVGMGSAERPLPRLLTAARWNVRPVPWLFRIVHAARVARELPLLRARPALRMAGGIAAATGAARVAAAALEARKWPARFAARGFTLDRVSDWHPAVDDLWNLTRDGVSFGVVRDRGTLACLYPPADGRYLIYMLRSGGDIAAWAVCLNTRMRQHAHFGDLQVATVLDQGGLPSALPALASRVSDALADEGADVVMTNQSHAIAVAAFKRAGFAAGPSNYLFAASKDLARAIEARRDAVHVTRGDGDGRIHL